MRFISVGAGSLVDAGRIVSAAAPDSAPLKRLVQDAKEEGSAIDLCQGKKCRSVLILENGMVVLSAFEMENIERKLKEASEEKQESDRENGVTTAMPAGKRPKASVEGSQSDGWNMKFRTGSLE